MHLFSLWAGAVRSTVRQQYIIRGLVCPGLVVHCSATTTAKAQTELQQSCEGRSHAVSDFIIFFRVPGPHCLGHGATSVVNDWRYGHADSSMCA